MRCLRSAHVQLIRIFKLFLNLYQNLPAQDNGNAFKRAGQPPETGACGSLQTDQSAGDAHGQARTFIDRFFIVGDCGGFAGDYFAVLRGTVGWLINGDCRLALQPEHAEGQPERKNPPKRRVFSFRSAGYCY
ncbi:hypothetical protein ALQ34_103627 [Pseudomonas syringae pv. maculicola]|nr:hypothetical protein ALQ34_103627 [Pseudomonas syringae pv. maculicola]